MSQTYDINYATKDKLVNFNSQINKIVVKITKSEYFGQDAGEGLRPNHCNCVEIHWSAAQFGYTPLEIGNRARWCQWTWTPLVEHNSQIRLGSRACGIEEVHV